MIDRGVTFWRRMDWRVWRQSYIAQNSESERLAWINHHNKLPKADLPAAEQEEQRVLAHVRDISLGGIILVASQSFESGTLLKVELQSTPVTTPLLLLARVIQVMPRSNESWILSCCFARELSDDDLKIFGAERVRPATPDGRAWVRFPCEKTVSFFATDTGQQAHTAKIVNISPGGIGLLVSRNLEVGNILDLEISSGAEAPHKVRARIVHVTPQADEKWLLGCTFVEELSEQGSPTAE